MPYTYSRKLNYNFYISNDEIAKSKLKLDYLIRCEKCNQVFFCSDFILDGILCQLCDKKNYIDYSVISHDFKAG